MDDIKRRQTASALAAVILLVSILKNEESLALAALVLVVGNIFDLFFVRWLVWAWEKITYFVGGLVGKALLGLVYVVFVTPLGWLFRLFNRTSVKIFFGTDQDTYFHKINEEKGAESFENLW